METEGDTEEEADAETSAGPEGDGEVVWPGTGRVPSPGDDEDA